MPKLNVVTRWRELSNPVSPYDPIQPDGIRYEEGKLPVLVMILCWDGDSLLGPYRFPDREEADHFLTIVNPKITHFLVVPSPFDVYDAPEIKLGN